MDQSLASRVRKAEQDKQAKLLESIPEPDETEELVSFVYEDFATNKVDISSVIFCRNSIIEGSLRALCTLMDKANILITMANEKYWPPILLAANSVATIDASDEVTVIETLVPFTKFVDTTYDMLIEAFSLFRNITQQMRVVREMDNETLLIAKKLDFHKVWRTLGDILSIFVQLDEIIISRPEIRKMFIVSNDVYAKEQETNASVMVENNNTKEESSEDMMSEEEFIIMLREMERVVMSGNSFRFAYEQTLGDLDTNENFAKEMADTLMKMYLKWEKSTNDEVPEKQNLMSICSLAAYHYNHFANYSDSKLIKTIFGSYKKVGWFNIVADVQYSPCHFLIREIGDTSMFEKSALTAVAGIKEDLKSVEYAEGMLREAYLVSRTTEAWVGEIGEKVRERQERTPTINLARVCLEISDLFLKGVSLADKMTRLLKTSLKIYNLSGTSKIQKTDAYHIFDIIEAVKTISYTFEENWRHILEATSLASQQWRCHLIKMFEAIRTALKSSNLSEAIIEERDSALCVSRDALLYTASRGRMVIIRTAMEFGGAESILKSPERRQLNDLMVRLGNLIEPRTLASRVTNCSFLIYTKSLIGIYWETLMTRKPPVDNIRKFCSAIGDCVQMWSLKRHVITFEEPEKEYFEMMRKGFLGLLCCKVENDLRFMTHRHLEMDDTERMDENDSDYLVSLFRHPIYRMYNQMVDINEFVSRYLEKMFYNLTVIAPHDAKTYAQMAQIAEMKYDIKLIHGNLPLGGIDESCNIIELAANLAHVAISYNYSLSMQMFFEKQSPNKQLHVISRFDMITSLRKYGVGVLPSAMNVAYQVLRRKLNIFNLFLSDDHIRALLETDIQQFEADKSPERAYQMISASKFHAAISKIGGTVLGGSKGEGSVKSGTTNDDEAPATYIDKFRAIITQIGNTLSFVQLMTSAAKCVEAELGDTLTSDVQRLFATLVINGMDDDVNADNGSIDGNRRDVIRRLRDEYTRINSSTNSNFNHLFVDVFRNAFLPNEDKENENGEDEEELGNDQKSQEKTSRNFGHLKNFYIIVPCLTLSQCKHMISCRNRVMKTTIQNDKDLTFTDDGFSIGIAYILTVLDLWPQFDSLNWFSTVFDCLEEESNNTVELAKTSQGAKLKAERIDVSIEEFQQMFYTIESGKVFFTEDDKGVDPEEHNLF